MDSTWDLETAKCIDDVLNNSLFGFSPPFQSMKFFLGYIVLSYVNNVLCVFFFFHNAVLDPEEYSIQTCWQTTGPDWLVVFRPRCAPVHTALIFSHRMP